MVVVVVGCCCCCCCWLLLLLLLLLFFFFFFLGGRYCKSATRIPVSNFGRNFPLSSDYRPFLAVETSSEESVNSSIARFI